MPSALKPGVIDAPIQECWACGEPAEPTDSYYPERLRSCDSCGLLFAPERVAQDVHDLYRGDTYFEAYGGGMVEETSHPLRMQEANVRLGLTLRASPTGRLLEIGAAAGYFLVEARTAGYDVVGIEPTDNAASAARARFGLDMMQGFVEELDLPGASFDVACAWHVLEHVPEPVASLERVRSRIKPGGALLVEVPNITSVEARRQGISSRHFDPDHHVAHYGPSSLRALLERSGYDVELVQTVAYTAYRPVISPVTLASAAWTLALSRGLPWRPHPWRFNSFKRWLARAKVLDSSPDPGGSRSQSYDDRQVTDEGNARRTADYHERCATRQQFNRK